MTKLSPTELSNQKLFNTDVVFKDIDSYYRHITKELLTKSYLKFFISFGYSYNASNISKMIFANIASRSDVERAGRIEYQLSEDPFFTQLFGSFFDNAEFTQILEAHGEKYCLTFNKIPSHLQDFILDKLTQNIFDTKSFPYIHASYKHFHRLSFYVTTALFHNDINFVKAFTKQVSFNTKSSSLPILHALIQLHNFVDFNQGSLLLDTIFNSVLGKQLTLSDTNTLNDKSEQMFKFVSTLKDDLQDKFYNNLLKKLSSKEQFLGKNIIENPFFPSRLYDKQISIFKDISTQSAVEQLDDPQKLAKEVTIKNNLFLQSTCAVKLTTVQEFYKKLYTKKTFPLNLHTNVSIDHVHDSINLSFYLRLNEERTDILMILVLNGDPSKFDKMQELQNYFNQNALSFLDKSLLFSHKLLTQFNETHFFNPHIKIEHKNIQDLFYLFIAEHRENSLHEEMSKNIKETTKSHGHNKI